MQKVEMLLVFVQQLTHIHIPTWDFVPKKKKKPKKNKTKTVQINKNQMHTQSPSRKVLVWSIRCTVARSSKRNSLSTHLRTPPPQAMFLKKKSILSFKYKMCPSTAARTCFHQTAVQSGFNSAPGLVRIPLISGLLLLSSSYSPSFLTPTSSNIL